MKKFLLLCVLGCGHFVLSSCGGGISTPPPPAQVTHLVLSGPTPDTVGTAVSISVTAMDSSNSIASNYSGTVRFTSTDPHAQLPASFTLANGSGNFTATFETVGTQTITATDTAKPSLAGTSNPITLTPPAQLAITSGAPPNGTAGDFYAAGAGFSLTASGGIPPYTWSWSAAPNSSVPPGLTLTNATISGRPTLAGTFNVVVQVADSASPPAQKTALYGITIDNPPPPIISALPAPPAGALNVIYPGYTFAASGGLAPLSWSESGALPSGMILSTSGELSGTPTATGLFPITVAVQDALHQNAPPQGFIIEIDAQLPSFTATGSMQTARASHTATLLANGKVVVIGGVGDNGKTALASTELFDPAAGLFTSTGNLMTPRLFHTATLLQNGKVLVTGGQDVNGNAIAEAELFDPSTGSFTTTGAMNSVRNGHTATLLNDGRVLVAGGIDSNRAPLSTAELFDPTTEKFTLTASPMTASRAHHAATLLSSGKVLLAGGSDNIALGDIFDPAGNIFASTNTGGTEATFLTATLLADGRVLLAGGEVALDSPCKIDLPNSVASASLFDTGSVSFSATGGMSFHRAQHTATVLGDGKVLVAGGADIRTNVRGCFPHQRISVLVSAELYDPVHGAFALTSSMTTARSGHTATLLGNGHVLVIGGVDANGNPLAGAELYK